MWRVENNEVKRSRDKEVRKRQARVVRLIAIYSHREHRRVTLAWARWRWGGLVCVKEQEVARAGNDGHGRNVASKEK